MCSVLCQFFLREHTRHVLIFEVDILYTSMEFNGVIDMCLIIKFVLYAIYLYPSSG